MIPHLPLAPRYRLDDELPWLEGIDPSRCYWIRLNGEPNAMQPIPGLSAPSFEAFKRVIKQFRALQAGEHLSLSRAADGLTIHCISSNCYGIEVASQAAPTWHLFDRETLESLLMTGHPDWQCAAKDVELGRRLLSQSWKQPTAV